MCQVDFRASGPGRPHCSVPGTGPQTDCLGQTLRHEQVRQTARLPGNCPRPSSGRTPGRGPPMTTLPPASNRRRTRGVKLALTDRFMVTLCRGGGIGTLVALALYVRKTAYVGLAPLGLALLLS